MLFGLFSKNKKKPQAEKGGRTVLGHLFNPDIGTSLRPIGETTTVFINLLAMVFASQGLFPVHHPSLSGVKGAPRLTLPMVINTAWNNLVISKDTVPQVILFFAVLTILGFSALALIIIVFSMLMGTAHAAAGCGTGLFTPCDPASDVATSWVNYLFFGQTMTNYLGDSGQVIPQSALLQKALTTALAMYSNAILIVAAIVLFYHLASMIVETAHHGVVMGKDANQIWAPIRLVFAIGLLVPLAGGLNTGQYMVIKIGMWGSNMADQVWNIFLTQLAADTRGGVSPPPPYARKAVYDTILSEACMAAYNVPLNGWTGNSSSSTGSLNDSFSNWKPPTDGTSCVPPRNAIVDNTGNVTTRDPAEQGMQVITSLAAAGGSDTAAPPPPTITTYQLAPGTGTLASQTVCGHYTFQPNAAGGSSFSQTVQSQMFTSGANAIASGPAVDAFNSMRTSARAYVAQWMPFHISKCMLGADDQQRPVNAAPVEKIMGGYLNTLGGLFKTAAAGLAADLANVAVISTSQGWVSAGAWFNTIAREQAELMDITAAVPATEGPKLAEVAGDSYYNTQVLPYLLSFKKWVDTVDPAAAMTDSGLPSQQQQVLLAEVGLQQAQGDTDSTAFDKIFIAVDHVATWNGVWQSYKQSNTAADGSVSASPVFKLGIQFNGANPLAEMSALGHANIKTSIELFDYSLLATGVSSGVINASQGDGPIVLLFKNLGEAGKGVGELIGLASVIFFTSGFMLAYYLPLIPFFHFLFNILTWVISLFEAVIAMPLVALAHLTPEGKGLPGAKAGIAYFFIFNIFLRPVLMVFGLIVAYLLFFVAVSYMNMLYLQAVAGGGGLAHGHMALAHMVYSIMYILMLYICANNCFKLISHLPDNALRWMGQQGLSYGSLTGDPSQIEGKVALASGAIDNQIMQNANKAVAGIGGAVGGVAGGLGRALPVVGGPEAGAALGVGATGLGALALAGSGTHGNIAQQRAEGLGRALGITSLTGGAAAGAPAGSPGRPGNQVTGSAHPPAVPGAKPAQPPKPPEDPNKKP